MALDFLKSDKSEEQEIIDDDFVELDAEMAEADDQVVIRAATLEEFGDVDGIQEHLRNDHIVWINISPLKDKDMTDLKRAVKRLKKTVKNIDGDMAGVDEDWIVACPGYARIERSGKQVDDAQ